MLSNLHLSELTISQLAVASHELGHAYHHVCSVLLPVRLRRIHQAESLRTGTFLLLVGGAAPVFVGLGFPSRFLRSKPCVFPFVDRDPEVVEVSSFVVAVLLASFELCH